MRVSKDVVNAIANKFGTLATEKIKSIPEPKHSSDQMGKDLLNFIQTEMMKELPSILALYQKKHPSHKFDTLKVCKRLSFEDLHYLYRFESFVKLDEEVSYREKVNKIKELKEKVINDIVLRLPFIKTQKEYDEYLAEVEKQFK